MNFKITTGDCIDILRRNPDVKARLIFADPPYNQNVDYGPGTDDRRTRSSYLNWCKQWLAECAAHLTYDGSLWVLISHEYAADMDEYSQKLLYAWESNDADKAFDALLDAFSGAVRLTMEGK